MFDTSLVVSVLENELTQWRYIEATAIHKDFVEIYFLVFCERFIRAPDRWFSQNFVSLGLCFAAM